MAATPTLDTVPAGVDERYITYFGTVALSGNYATGGETVDFGTLRIHSAKPPSSVVFTSLKGYPVAWSKGTTISNQKIVCFSAVATEVAAGAMPAGQIADTVRFVAHFPKA